LALRLFLTYSIMKKIKLTQGKYALVDEEDYERLNQFKWQAQKSTKGNLYYATRCILKYKIIDGEKWFNRRTVRMHNEVMDGLLNIDHIDNDGLNNTKNNLRHSTISQNMMNRRTNGTKTSKYKGVNQRGISNQWRAAICFSNKLHNLGTYSSETDAAIAYNIAAVKMHGDFASLNDVKYKNGYIPQKIKTHKTPNRSSIYRGVCFIKSTKKWQSSIKVNNKLIHIGTFENEELAAKAYNEAAIKYHKENASINNVNYI
jgi:hypothetical protein